MSWNELARASRFASGTRAFSRVISAFCTARSAILLRILTGVKPGVPFSTTKPLTW
jgi:hypothetical protein